MKTENKILLPIVLLMIAAAIMGCKTEPELCALGAHLGIGESCSGTSCTLEEYRTANMKNSGHADYFKWPIYRVGTKSHYTDTELTNTVTNILAGYKGLSSTSQTNLKNSSLSEVRITFSAPHDWYTWNGSNLGIYKGSSSTSVRGLLADIVGDGLEMAQILQAVNTIRLAAGKDSDTEQLPVLAGALLCTRSVLFIKRKTDSR